MTTDPCRGPVVVGIDGSDEALRAAEYGAWEANRHCVPLRLVFAHQAAPMWGPSTLLLDDHRWEQNWVGDFLTEVTTQISAAHPDIAIETAVIPSRPAAALVAESKHASLVVTATRSRGGLVGHLSGSVSAQVATHSHTPVIVLRPNGGSADPAAFAGLPVVVGLDGSPESAAAMPFAVEEASARGSGVRAVYVWNVHGMHDMSPIVPDQFIASEEEDKAPRLLTEATEGWSELYPEVTITREVVHAVDSVDALIRFTEDPGLIVVGSRGHGGFLGLRLGSTVDGLIRSADAPVVVVRGESEIWW